MSFYDLYEKLRQASLNLRGGISNNDVPELIGDTIPGDCSICGRTHIAVLNCPECNEAFCKSCVSSVRPGLCEICAPHDDD